LGCAIEQAKSGRKTNLTASTAYGIGVVVVQLHFMIFDERAKRTRHYQV